MEIVGVLTISTWVKNINLSKGSEILRNSEIWMKPRTLS